jgi:hypothetical protein
MEWNGTERNGTEWNGMEWNGMEWNGMEWNGMEWNGLYFGVQENFDKRDKQKSRQPSRLDTFTC